MRRRRERKEKKRNGYILLATVGIFGMVAFKTGRLQRSIQSDIEAVGTVKSTEAGYPNVEKSQTYLTQVKSLFSFEKEKKFFENFHR